MAQSISKLDWFCIFIIDLILCFSITDCFYYKKRLWERGERSSVGCCSEDPTWPSTTRNQQPFQWEEQLQGAFRDRRTSQAEGWGCKVSTMCNQFFPGKCSYATDLNTEIVSWLPVMHMHFVMQKLLFEILRQFVTCCRCRLRELHTLKGHVESVVKLKGLDIDTIQQHYTVWGRAFLKGNRRLKLLPWMRSEKWMMTMMMMMKLFSNNLVSLD